ncbi:MAG TPA: amidohydrolase family protein [Caulobacteraceae bacterium]|nr:amidohydrolase family protein [Caulobacteraceae bacterium]
MRRLLIILAIASATSVVARAQTPPPKVVAYDQPVIAFTHVELIDGTGKPAQHDMTVVVRNGRIAAVAPASTPAPADATIIDGTGKTLLPGFVMMHEHMFYPTGHANYTEMLYSFPRLYLAGGTTTMRTAGSMNAYADLQLRDEINAGRAIGPDIDVTGPYLNGPGLPILKVHVLKDANEAVQMVNYWSDLGVTSFKGYMHLTRAELQAIDATAHKRGRKVTAHLCSITYHEAIDAGIDNLENGFFVSTDFVTDKKPDVCPDRGDVVKSQVALDPDGPQARVLIKDLIDHHVALTSTLTVFETSVPGRPEAPERALSVLIPEEREQYESTWKHIQAQKESPSGAAYPKLARMEKAFVDAGGFLMAGTDPTGYGGVVPGFAGKREVELLVEDDGFSFEQAVKIATLNGAIFEGLDKDRGTVEVGKRADLILIDGDPLKDVTAIEHMPLVFKNGKGYRTDAIIDEMKGVVGLN